MVRCCLDHGVTHTVAQAGRADGRQMRLRGRQRMRALFVASAHCARWPLRTAPVAARRARVLHLATCAWLAASVYRAQRPAAHSVARARGEQGSLAWPRRDDSAPSARAMTTLRRLRGVRTSRQRAPCSRCPPPQSRSSGSSQTAARYRASQARPRGAVRRYTSGGRVACAPRPGCAVLTDGCYVHSRVACAPRPPAAVQQGIFPGLRGGSRLRPRAVHCSSAQVARRSQRKPHSRGLRPSHQPLQRYSRASPPGCVAEAGSSHAPSTAARPRSGPSALIRARLLRGPPPPAAQLRSSRSSICSGRPRARPLSPGRPLPGGQKDSPHSEAHPLCTWSL